MTNYFEVDKVITCAGTAPVASTAVDIYAIKEGKDPLLMKRQLAVTAGAWTTTMTVPSSYVSPFGEVYLKVVDSFNPTIAGTKFYTVDPTLTIDTPTLTAGVEGNVTGTTNYPGQNLEIDIRLAGQTPEDSWTVFDLVTADESGDWEATGTVASAGTYDFRVIDENIDPAICSAQVEDVVVASGTVRIQILSENCDFIQIDSIPVGTTKIAIAGHIYNMSGVVKLGGETIDRGSSSNLAVLILYDIMSKSIDWIITSSNLVGSTTASYYAKILNADDTYVYWLRQQSGYYLTKVTISDGTKTDSSVFGGTTITGASGKASMCADANYCYVIYPYATDKRRVMGVRIAKSNLALGTATDLAFSPAEWTEGNNMDVVTDGTYLYWIQNAGLLDTQIVRSSMTIASQSIVATYHAYNPADPPFQTLPYNAVYANSKLYVAMYDDSPAVKWIYDGTNRINVGGRLSLANGVIFSSISGTLQKLNSILGIDWNQDFTTDTVIVSGTVVYQNGNYYFVGTADGDFDGNNPANTKRCAIIGKIDIDTGEI